MEDKDATYRFTKAEADEMRAAYKRIEEKQDKILRTVENIWSLWKQVFAQARGTVDRLEE